MTMKKSVIKRRKRVIPASHEAALEGGSVPAESVESSSPPPDTFSSERGSMNPDGSVNLGLRRRPDHHPPQHDHHHHHHHQPPQQAQQPLQLVPESVLRQHRPSPPMPSGDLTQYSSNARHHLFRDPVPGSLSLTDDNRLAPITSLPAASSSSSVGRRQTSLSPASFLSPARKRSFGETESPGSAAENPGDGGNNKRLSSIKSILNPTGAGATLSAPAPPPLSSPHMAGAEELARQRAYMNSPTATLASAPSPGAYSSAGSPTPGGALPCASAQGYAADATRLGSEGEASRAERRAALQRDADRMREMLAAKERELAELGL